MTHIELGGGATQHTQKCLKWRKMILVDFHHVELPPCPTERVVTPFGTTRLKIFMQFIQSPGLLWNNTFHSFLDVRQTLKPSQIGRIKRCTGAPGPTDIQEDPNGP